MALLRKENENNQSFANFIGKFTPICNTIQHGLFLTLYWIVDSGTTDHISKSSPTHNKSGTHCGFVKLLDGGKAEINFTRSIKLSSDLVLERVLHVPKFRVNLFLVSKLTQALRYNVKFYPDFYVVRDVVTKKTIGLGKQYNGLYYLKPSQNPHLVDNVNCTFSLWHQ